MPISKNSIYKAISELMSLGYMQRVEHKVKNLRRDVSYKCADYPAFEKIPLKQSLYEKKKNSNNFCRNPKFRNHEKWDDNKEPITSPTASLKDTSPPSSSSSDRSKNSFSLSLSPPMKSEAVATQENILINKKKNERETELLSEARKREKAYYGSQKTHQKIHPDSKVLSEAFQTGLHSVTGKRGTIPSVWVYDFSAAIYEGDYSKEEIKLCMKYAFQDKFWKTRIHNPRALLKNLSQLLSQATSKDYSSVNKQMAFKLKEKLRRKDLFLMSDKGIKNVETQKIISYNLEPEQFAEQLFETFGEKKCPMEIEVERERSQAKRKKDLILWQLKTSENSQEP